MSVLDGPGSRAILLATAVAISVAFFPPAGLIGAGVLAFGATFARDGLAWVSERPPSAGRCALAITVSIAASVTFRELQPRGPVALVLAIPVVVLGVMTAGALLAAARRPVSAPPLAVARTPAQAGRRRRAYLGYAARVAITGLVVGAWLSPPRTALVLLITAAALILVAAALRKRERTV